MTKMRRYFITGLLVVLPVLITFYVMVAILSFLDNILGKYITSLVGFRIPGLGILIFALLILLAGMFAVNFLGKRILPFIEKLFVKIPLVHKIYPATKQMTQFLLSDKRESFKKVVLIEYPRKGLYSIAFVTNDGMKEVQEKVRSPLLNIFIPSSPGPLTGYFLLVPENEVKYLDISIEQGLRLIVSGGVVNP